METSGVCRNFKAHIYLTGRGELNGWAFRNRREIQFEGKRLILAPPEYAIVRKLEYFREGGSEKHLRIRSMLAVSGDQIQRGRVERVDSSAWFGAGMEACFCLKEQPTALFRDVNKSILQFGIRHSPYFSPLGRAIFSQEMGWNADRPTPAHFHNLTSSPMKRSAQRYSWFEQMFVGSQSQTDTQEHMKTKLQNLLRKLALTVCLATVISTTQASTDYAPAVWRSPCNATYYTTGYGHKFHVVHDMEGYYAASISMYCSCSYSAAGMHYWCNGKKDTSTDAAAGQITQTTREAYYAWHAVCWNRYSTGCEHEGFVSNPAWWTPDMYSASAALTRHLADKFGFAKDRNHVVAHGNRSNAAWCSWAEANLGIDAHCNAHTDPGPYWDWSQYMNLINSGAGSVVNPPYIFDANAQGWTAGNSMSGLAWTGSGWPGCIYNDQKGNDAYNFGPACSFSGGADASVSVSVYPQSGTTANHNMQVFWKTDQDNAFTASKSSPIVTYSAQNTWASINLDINANYAGYYQKTVNQFRLDFDNSNSGTRWILNHFIVQTTPRYWFSSGTDGWTSVTGLGATWWAGGSWPGVLVADQTGNDAHMVKDVSSLNYRGGQNDRVHVRLYPQSGSGINHDIQLFWATSADNSYSEAKSVGPIYYAAQNSWVDIWFDVGANGNWAPKNSSSIPILKSLRLDFDQSNKGTRWIVDEIQVVHNSSASFAAYNNASIVSTSIPTTVTVGQAFTATVTMKNCGNKTWNSDSTAHRLGSQNPQDNNRWGLTRANLPADTAPGASATFTINAIAPTAVGSYAFDWKMVEENVQWFGPVVQSTINVISAGPAAPTGVKATAAAWNQVNVSWTDSSSNETGFRVERGTSSSGPFTAIATLGANVTSYANFGLSAATVYYYRVFSVNSGGDSAASNVASVTTPKQPPAMSAISDMTGTEGQLLAFTVSASNPNQQTSTSSVASWEGSTHGTMEVVFRKPSNSATTSSFIDAAATNYAMVVTSGPSGFGGSKCLKSQWSFKTGMANYWVRLNTYAAPVSPNPTIALDQACTFRVYSSKALKLGIGVRETGTTAAYGADGGTSGTIEWVGVTNVASSQPIPNRSVAASAWTTLTFNIPSEPQWAFTGDGKVDQSGAKGVLEEIIMRGEGGTGQYDTYLDDVSVVVQNTLAFTLDAGAPSGAAIERRTGKFTWTPAAGQAGNYNITIRVTDRLGLQDYKTFNVKVTGVGNHAPVLAAIGNKSVNEGSALSFTAAASDIDAGSVLAFSLDAGAPSGASIDSSTGAFTWTPTEAQGPGSYPITVRVTDNASPASNDWETITVTVNEVNTAPVLAAIADQTVDEGATVTAMATATDADVPVNTLTYSLDAGAPVGMTINPSSGAIAWATTEAHGPDAYPVTVRVTDSGGLSATTSFNVIVNEVNTAPVLTVNTTVTSVQTVTDFESFQDGSYNGTVLFRHPAFSASTSAFLDDAVTNITTVTSDYPGGDTLMQVLHASWSFKTGQTNPWLRLVTYNTPVLPNPTVKFTQHVRFKIYADKAVQVALALRETGTGADVGQNGGTTGTIEFVGVSGMNGTCPIPTRTVSAGTWQTVDFDLPSEPKTAFTGNGVLDGAKGVIEELAIVPAGGAGAYNVYVDDLQVVTVTTSLTVDTGTTLTLANISAMDADFPAQTLTFSLDTNTAPAGAEIEPGTGVFTWTPSVDQGPSTNVITIRVTDDGPGNLSASQDITVIVNKVNMAPVLNTVETVKELNAGGVITLTAEATDVDGNALTFSLQNNPPAGAMIDPVTGVFTWTPPNQLGTNIITVRVTDNGVPPLYDEKDWTIVVIPTNAPPVLSLGTARVTEPVVSFETFTNATPNEQVMFKKPGNSATTSSFIDTAATNYTTVTTSFPAGNANAGAKVLRATWSFKTGISSYWVRLTTGNTTLLPNPTINASARLKFDLYTDKALKVCVGIRETGTTAENGANGGTTGTIEWVGATSVTSGCPGATRTVNPGTWTTLEFDLPNDPKTTFTGDGALNGGQQVLEHIALIGAGGTGAYNVYLDNFQVVTTTALPGSVTMKVNSSLQFTASATDPDPGSGLEFGLDADAPASAVINPTTGAFAWTPTAAGTSSSIAVIVNDNPVNGALVKSDSKALTVTVNADSLAPQSAEGSFVAAGETVALTWDACPGKSYQVQYKDGDSWLNLSEPIVADSENGSVAVSNEGGERFLRVVEIDEASSEQ